MKIVSNIVKALFITVLILIHCSRPHKVIVHPKMRVVIMCSCSCNFIPV